MFTNLPLADDPLPSMQLRDSSRRFSSFLSRFSRCSTRLTDQIVRILRRENRVHQDRRLFGLRFRIRLKLFSDLSSELTVFRSIWVISKPSFEPFIRVSMIVSVVTVDGEQVVIAVVDVICVITLLLYGRIRRRSAQRNLSSCCPARSDR